MDQAKVHFGIKSGCWIVWLQSAQLWFFKAIISVIFLSLSHLIHYFLCKMLARPMFCLSFDIIHIFFCKFLALILTFLLTCQLFY